MDSTIRTYSTTVLVLFGLPAVLTDICASEAPLAPHHPCAKLRLQRLTIRREAKPREEQTRTHIVCGAVWPPNVMAISCEARNPNAERSTVAGPN